MFKDFMHHLQERERGFDARREPHFAPFGRGSRQDHHDGPPHGHGPKHHPRHERGFGPGPRERLFDGGELQLVILHLLAEKPSYGYELIKSLEERLAGGYAPSPGVIYPNLTMLEEKGFAELQPSDSGKKVYGVTEAGHAELKAHARRLADVMERLEARGKHFDRGRSPQLMRAFEDLRGAVKSRIGREDVTPEQIKAVADAIQTAARTIDAL